MMPFLHRVARDTAEENPLWLIVLCDLMTNLMLFFLIMYSFTLQTPKKKAQWLRSFQAQDLIAPAPDKAAAVVGAFREAEAAEKLAAVLKRDLPAGGADVSVTERAIRVSLRNKLLFDTARAELVGDSGRTLDALAKILKELPNEIVVEGHTDDVPVAAGPFKTNWELSVARSYGVLERLQAAGVPPSRLVAAGYGPYHPLVPNEAPGGRAANRRVEILIVRGGPEDER